MSYRFAGQILNINYVFDIETRSPNQFIYELMLNKKWKETNSSDYNTDYDFVIFALKYLPNESFIVFSFDASSRYFVQFANLNGQIFLNIPCWKTNSYAGKFKEAVKLVRKEGCKKRYNKRDSVVQLSNYFQVHGFRNGNRDIEVFFGNNYLTPSRLTFTIVNKLFKIDNPLLIGYETDHLKLKY